MYVRERMVDDNNHVMYIQYIEKAMLICNNASSFSDGLL